MRPAACVDQVTPVRQFEYVDERTLRGANCTDYDVLDAVQQLPWVRQLCPFMPHEYAILRNSPEQAWFVVEAMIRLSPKSYRAFFRGYQSANRYWEAPDGRRYWRGRFEIDRWDASDTEGLRRRDEGAHAIKDWMARAGLRTALATTSRAPTASGGPARSSLLRAMSRVEPAASRRPTCRPAPDGQGRAHVLRGRGPRIRYVL